MAIALIKHEACGLAFEFSAKVRLCLVIRHFYLASILAYSPVSIGSYNRE